MRRSAALENRDQARRRRQVERLFLRDFIIGNTEKREVDVGILKVRPSAAQLKSADISVVVFVPGVLDQLKVVRFQLLKSVETRIEYLVQVIDLVVLVHEPRCEKAVYLTSPHQVPGPSPKIFVGPSLRSFESFGQVPASRSVPAHTSSDVMMTPATNNKRAMHRKLILASPSDQLLLLHVAAQR